MQQWLRRRVVAITLSAILLVIFIAPLQLEHIFYYDQRRVMQLLLLSIVPLLFLWRNYSVFILQILMQNKVVSLLLSLFLIIGLLSSIKASFMGIAFVHYTQLCLLILLSLTVAYSVVHKQQNINYYMWLGCLFFIVVAAYIGYGYVVLFTENIGSNMLNSVSALTVHPQFLNPRFLDQILTALVPLSSGLLLIVKNRYLKIIAITAVSTGLYLMILTASRASFVILISMIVIGMIFFRPLFYRYCKYMLLCFVLAFFAYYTITFLMEASVGLNMDRSDGFLSYSDRWPLIQAAILAGLSENIFLGLGPGMYPAFVYFYSETTAAHPHNIWALLLAEWGIINAIIVMMLVIMLIVRFFKIAKLIQDNIYAMVIVFAVSSMFIKGLVSGVTIMPAAQLTFVLTIGLLLAIFISKANLLTFKSTIEQRIFKLLLGTICMIASAYLLLYSLHSMSRLTTNAYHYGTACYIKNKDVTSLSPNLWSNGWFMTHNKSIEALSHSADLKCV